MNKEIKEAWLVLAALFKLPSNLFKKDFIDIFTNSELDNLSKRDNGIYVVFKNIDNQRDEEFENFVGFKDYQMINNILYTIYFIKIDKKFKTEFDLLKVLGSKALSKNLICQIAIHYNTYIGNTFNNILDVITFAKTLNKKSLGNYSQAFIFNLILQILLS